MRALLAAPLIALVALSGCVASDDDPLAGLDGVGSVTVEDDNATLTGQGVAIRSFEANATGLTVDFTFDAVAGQASASGNASAPANGTGNASRTPMSWTLAFGDGNQTNGTSVPGAANHTYAAPGAYNATLTVRSGNASATRTLAVNATGNATAAAGPVQDPIHLEGSVLCLPTGLANGEIAGDEQTFTVNAGQGTMTVTLAYDEATGLLEDLDIVLTDPAGEQTESAASGPEPPIVLEAPAAGEWTASIVGYSCVLEQEYTIDVVFS